jgi:hypothetical protein
MLNEKNTYVPTKRSEQAAAGESAKQRQNRSLNFMIIAGAIIIFLCGFVLPELDDHGHSYFSSNSRFSFQDHWKCWEFGALFWTLLFVGHYWLTASLNVKKRQALIRFCFLTLLPLTFFAGIFLLYSHEYPHLHVLFVIMVGISLMLTDWLLSRHIRAQKEKKAFRESFLIAGVPTVSAYLVLGIYLLMEKFVLRHAAMKPQDLEVFMAGAISFQLLISNVIQKGWLRRNVRARSRTTSKTAQRTGQA